VGNARGALAFGIAAAGWLIVASTAGAQGAAPPAGCTSAEHHQFDFWVGDWEVTDQTTGQRAGHNRIESILGGCALLENWTGASGGSGKSLNQYYARDGHWHQIWIDSQGGRLDLAGAFDAATKTMTMRGKTPSRDGGTVEHEISWELRDDGSVRQHWRSSKDGGKSWIDAFDGLYRKATG